MKKLKPNGLTFFKPKLKVIILLLLCAGINAQANLKGKLSNFETVFQDNTITGVVNDADGQPLPGANIIEKGTTNGVQTDFDGNFSIKTSSKNATLIVSYVGFITKEIVLQGKTVLSIALEEDASQLDEVIVVGYGTTSVKETTGAVANIKVADVLQSATPSVDQLLQGRVAGLNMSVSTAQPGARVNVNIRASVSPNGNGSPLYVIDGVPVIDDSVEPGLDASTLGFGGGVDRSPLSTINPSDIESIDVIKDAGSTAIYGSAAANGVIFITTKKGKVGKTTVSYKMSTTVQTPKDYIDYLDAKGFMGQHNRLARDRYLFNNNLAPYGAGNEPVGGFTPLFSQADIDNAGAGTDYVGGLIKTGFIQEHNISVSSGTETTKIYSSFNYYNNDAILKNSDFERFTARFNINQKLGDRFDLSVRTNMSQINSNNASTGSNSGGSEKFNSLQAAFAFAPNIAPREADGTYSRSYNGLITNPFAFLEIQDKLRTNKFSITPKLDVSLSEDLSLTVVGAMDRSTATRQFFLPTTVENAIIPDGISQLATNRNDAYTGESYLSYNKSFGKDRFSAVVGAGIYETLSDGFSQQGIGFFTNANGFNNVGLASSLTENTQDSFRTETTKISQFARVNYVINGKYILNAVVRRDGASNFAENNKWGVFPGISAAWRISDESFLENTKVSNLKLRLGYGQVGNVDLADNAFQLYTESGQFIFGTTTQPGVVLSQVANPDFKWETNTSFDIGLDFGFFNQRINGSLELYQRTAKDLIDFDLLPSNNAVGRIITNVGSTQATGIDFALNTTNILTDDFEWSTNFTVTTSKSEWLERNPTVELPSYMNPTGQIGDFYGWETDGLIESLEEVPNYMAGAFPGNVKYVDQNEDGVLDIDDVVKLGTAGPRVNYGIGTNFRYKNFTLGSFAYGNAGNPRNFGYTPDIGRISNASPSNTLTSVRDVWSFDNTDGFLPGIASNPYAGNNPTNTDFQQFTNAAGNKEASPTTDFLLKKVAFLRIKNINFGYKLPIASNSKLPITSVRFFVDLQNVAVFSNYDGFDPEFSDTNPYPQAFSSTLGVDIQF